MRSGRSLREVARQLGVSPSFVSQLENGKSQPSVATLYSMAQLLGVSIDELFAAPDAELPVDGQAVPAPLRAVPEVVPRGADRADRADRAADGVDDGADLHLPAPEPAGGAADPGAFLNRSDFSSPVDAFPRDDRHARVSVTRPGDRPRLEMDTGVVWERLASNTGVDLDFIEIIYPPHSSSTNDGRMLQHAGSEYGYLLEGELEITVGFDVFTLHAGESLGFDSFQPHLFRNLRETPARGIWFVRHPHQ